MEIDWLYELLVGVQLDQFYSSIRDQLQITKLAHFDYVHADDLEKIGISKPGIRRLFDAVRKKKFQHWNKKFWSKLFGISGTSQSTKFNIPPRISNEPRTCIILQKDITLHNVLGTGSFAVVKRGEWRVRHLPSKVIPVAVKVLKTEVFTKQGGGYDDFHREVMSMDSIKHPNIISLYGVVFEPLMMIFELAPMGALLDYLRNQNGKVSLHLISKWSEQVAAGMTYLEYNRLIHRDLACRNILLANLELVKIGDFGLMRALPDEHECYVMSERRKVPFPWCAPESLRSKQFSHASDVWMFAVSLWEMYTFGEDPWMGLNGSEILRLVIAEGQRLSAPMACPPDMYMLMTKCWDLDPKGRPSFAAILKYMQMYRCQTGHVGKDYAKNGKMKALAGDEIVLIDQREELQMWKGQNQRTLEIDIYPANVIMITPQQHIQPIQKDKKKAHTLSGHIKASPTTPQPRPHSALDILDLPVHLLHNTTIEATQAHSTRSGNPTGNKQFNYSKLVNDRTRAIRERIKRDAQSKSLGNVKESLLIDLDLPPSTSRNVQPNRAEIQNNISILDQPIDVPEVHPGWDSFESDSLPTINTSDNKPTLFAAKSLDDLATVANSTARMSAVPSATTYDPFDLNKFWPIETNASMTQRPDYGKPINPPTNEESHNLSSYKETHNASAASYYSNSPQYAVNQPSNNISLNNTLTNASVTHSGGSSISDSYLTGCANVAQANSVRNNVPYFSYPQTTQEYPVANNASYPNYGQDSRVSQGRNLYSNSQFDENFYENIKNSNSRSDQTVTKPLADLSLDDKISASLNLSANRTSENIYANSGIYGQPSANPMNNSADTSRNTYQDTGGAPVYGNYDLTKNPQLLLETKDYYSKMSTPNSSNINEKNIYVPKDTSEKLSNFEKTTEVSKNYSAMKYSDYDYWSDDSFSTYSRTGQPYDIVNDNGSNLYSEIGEPSQSTNVRLYDEVYESVPRPHRPAPPCPTTK